MGGGVRALLKRGNFKLRYHLEARFLYSDVLGNHGYATAVVVYENTDRARKNRKNKTRRLTFVVTLVVDFLDYIQWPFRPVLLQRLFHAGFVVRTVRVQLKRQIKHTIYDITKICSCNRYVYSVLFFMKKKIKMVLSRVRLQARTKTERSLTAPSLLIMHFIRHCKKKKTKKTEN